MENWKHWLLAIAMGIIMILMPLLCQAEMKYFAVTAYNSWGESDYSNEVSADVPDDFTDVRLAWDAVDTATSYRVYFGDEPRTYEQTKGDGIDSKGSVTHFIVPCGSPTAIQIDLNTGEVTLIP